MGKVIGVAAIYEGSCETAVGQSVGEEIVSPSVQAAGGYDVVAGSGNVFYCVGEQVVGAAVHGGRGDNVVTGAGNIQDCVGDSCRA